MSATVTHQSFEFPAVTSALCVVIACCWYALGRSNGKKVVDRAPPALPSLPLVGSLPFLSGLSKLHVCLTEKSKTYGKVYSLYAGSKFTVVINGYDLIHEALIKNAKEFADRGDIYVVTHIWGDNRRGVAVAHAGEAHRQARKNSIVVLKAFGYGSRPLMEQKIHIEATHLLTYIRSMNGKSFYPSHTIEQCTMNVIYNLMFGSRFDYGDPETQHAVEIIHELVATVDSLYDVFPVLIKLPFIQRKLEDSKKLYHKFMEHYEAMVEESLKNDNDDSETNFVKEYVKLEGIENLDKRNLTIIVRDLILGGTETTSGSINWALIMLANHPDFQARLHREIDSVLSRDQLPSLNDKTKLPLVEALCLEVLRYRSAFPISLPRKTMAPTVIGGYEIPTGTEVIINMWSAHMDTGVWEEPEKFNPDRFLDDTGSVIKRDLMIAFSHGKRSCLGELLARQEMFLFLASLLQHFHVLPPEGEVRVKDGMCFARTLIPEVHEMRFVPRV